MKVKSSEQIKYETEIKAYEEDLHNWFVKYVDAAHCSYQYSDGMGNPDSLKCRMTDKETVCTMCKLQNWNDPEPIAPKYKRFFTPISSYCVECKNKETCKDIQPNIEWCLNYQKKNDE